MHAGVSMHVYACMQHMRVCDECKYVHVWCGCVYSCMCMCVNVHTCVHVCSMLMYMHVHLCLNMHVCMHVVCVCVWWDLRALLTIRETVTFTLKKISSPSKGVAEFPSI